MVNVELAEPVKQPLTAWLEAFKQHGVLVGVHRPETLRLVTHRHHTDAVIEEAVERLRDAAESMGARGVSPHAQHCPTAVQ